MIFREPHEAERWDRLVEVGQDMQPGRGYSLWQLVRIMAAGLVAMMSAGPGTPRPARGEDVVNHAQTFPGRCRRTGAPAVSDERARM